MKAKDALPFWRQNIDLADYIGVDAPRMSRFVRDGVIPAKYDAKIRQGIKARMKKLNKKAEEVADYKRLKG